MKLPTLKSPKLDKKKKLYIAGGLVVIIAIIVLAHAYSTGAFLCRLTGGAYVGQAVDAEQAANKLAVYAGAMERNNSPPLAYMAFNESRSQNMVIKAWLEGKQTEIKGFVIDAPYRDGGLRYGDGYFLSDDGYLYKLSSPKC